MRTTFMTPPPNPPAIFAEWDPFRQSREDSGLLKYSGEDNWGPQPPQKKPGDKYVIIGAATGIAIGAVWGFIINPILGILGIIVGGITGALAGSLVLSLIRRQRKGRIRKSSLKRNGHSEDSL